ncbi:meiotic recombination protein W68-like isoform X1 [Anastrepha ludens]|uniref:meiotic recombination protein W68-like isoform X1 n=1 Tax=Anastrepha ludens TaxID=28586 RepID=UPI0023B1D93A|nr:meiotic recombination protein W68-like isoform X1 [Anastrepha ludens]XP_053963057.1 meiotic recombination protein W68-like isoform X1 [Anastrepha ludens]
MMRYTLINNIEKIVIIFLENLISCSSGIFKFRRRRTMPLLERIVTYRLLSFQRSSLCFYILMEVHKILLSGGVCTLRELFYNDPAKCCKTVSICSSLKDVCALLHTTPWNLRIFASGKGLIAGAIRFLMINGDMIDCYTYGGAVVLPQDQNSIDRLETSASFVLLVEKNTIFSKLLSQKIFEVIGVDIILITGKGYPDLCTRYIVNRLSADHKLPVYALFDADPHGIDILLTYQFGSQKMSREMLKNLICPHIRWLGIHPTELKMFNFSSMALTESDNRKLQNMLGYNHLKFSLRSELQTLQTLQRKAHIDDLNSISNNFLINDYVPNKIRRNLVI